MTGRKPGYVCQTQNGLWRYSGFCTCTSPPAAHSGSCFCKEEAVEQAGMQIIKFLPYFHARVSCAEYFFSIVIHVFRHKREVERFEYLQAGLLKCCNTAK